MKNIVIQLANVNKRFGLLHAVRNVSFEIQRGQVCGFLGPNGAGKSTTIRMIMSILLPDSGVITVLGGSALDAKDRIGYLPEERGLYRKCAWRISCALWPNSKEFLARMRTSESVGGWSA